MVRAQNVQGNLNDHSEASIQHVIVCSEIPQSTLKSPQFRPIENYWAIMNRKLKVTGTVIKMAAQMKNWWDKIAKTVDETVVRRLMAA